MTCWLGVDVGISSTAWAVVGDTEAITGGTVASTVGLAADGELRGGVEIDTAGPSIVNVTTGFFERLGDVAPVVVGGTPYGVEALIGRVLNAVLDATLASQGVAPAVVALSHPDEMDEYRTGLLAEAARLAGIPMSQLRLVSHTQARANLATSGVEVAARLGIAAGAALTARSSRAEVPAVPTSAPGGSTLGRVGIAAGSAAAGGGVGVVGVSSIGGAEAVTPVASSATASAGAGYAGTPAGASGVGYTGMPLPAPGTGYGGVPVDGPIGGYAGTALPTPSVGGGYVGTPLPTPSVGGAGVPPAGGPSVVPRARPLPVVLAVVASVVVVVGVAVAVFARGDSSDSGAAAAVATSAVAPVDTGAATSSAVELASTAPGGVVDTPPPATAVSTTVSTTVASTTVASTTVAPPNCDTLLAAVQAEVGTAPAGAGREEFDPTAAHSYSRCFGNVPSSTRSSLFEIWAFPIDQVPSGLTDGSSPSSDPANFSLNPFFGADATSDAGGFVAASTLSDATRNVFFACGASRCFLSMEQAVSGGSDPDISVLDAAVKRIIDALAAAPPG